MDGNVGPLTSGGRRVLEDEVAGLSTKMTSMLEEMRSLRSVSLCWEPFKGKSETERTHVRAQTRALVLGKARDLALTRGSVNDVILNGKECGGT